MESTILRNGEQTVLVPAGQVELEGDLGIPADSRGIVLFAHGSGSSRFSPRNRYVAETLRKAGLSTLLIDLLTPEEEQVDMRTAHLRFDINMLASRLVSVTDWLAANPHTMDMKLGYFGASTGGGAALVAAAERPELIDAIVSRGGRPDLAGEALARVRGATLLIVGGDDVPVIKLNRQAQAMLRAENELAIVQGASHLFEEPGTLEEVAWLARNWFLRHLAGPQEG